MNGITDEDKLILKDMQEKFDYFMRKYEGFGINAITTVFYADGKLNSVCQIQLTKLMKAPVPHEKPRLIHP